MDLDEWGDDGDHDEIAMMKRNTEVLADRMRVNGFQQGSVTVSEQEAERVAMEIFGGVAHAAHNISFATGVTDAIRDLAALGIIESPPAITANPRKHLYQMRRCCSNGTFKKSPVPETNLFLLKQCDPQSIINGDAEPDVDIKEPSTPVKTGLLFVPKSVAAIKNVVAALDQIK
eukprot:TRINITY_DN3055_c0_g2_i1.p1 TRINITY_DN3055_c0_g2~~TRINITY_DN3055_c0_g2_i1.p1  ORF type:complete len:174 (+),score=34.61 TRINITY_DN3055_c0_g2_i1:46-567(+)